MGDRNHLRNDPEQQIDESTERGDRGASLVEYVLMVSLIALVCVVALGYFQEETAESLSQSSSAVAHAGT